MDTATTTHEALITLNQKLTEAQNRSVAQEASFGTFVKNVMARLDKDDLSDDDMAEIKQMMTTADAIGLTGLSDFGVTPDGQAVSTPAPVPVAPAPVDPTPIDPASVAPVAPEDDEALPSVPSGPETVPGSTPIVTEGGQAVQTQDGQSVVAQSV